MIPRKELKEYEKKSTEEGNLEEAEKATNEINDLLEKQILLVNLNIIEQNQREVLILLYHSLKS